MKHEDRYQEIVNNVSDAVYTVDLNTYLFTSVNRAGEQLTGYKKRDLFKRKVFELVAPEYHDVVKKKIAQKQQYNKATVYEVEIIRKDGGRVPIEISSRIYKKNGGSEILGIARNIAERKQIEKQKEVFMSLITHEMKTPLTSIALYIELLQKLQQSANGQANTYLQTIQKQIDILLELMKDFLEVNRLQIGKFTLVKEPVDINLLIDEVIAAFPKNGTHTIIKKGQIKELLFADRNRIMQVLMNLVTNAIKYSPQANKVIISIEKKVKTLTISVQDFGIGIPKEEQKKVFSLFFRTNYSQVQKIQGHGLGLYICQEIIKSHKGKIWFSSKEGEDTRFAFSLPIK